MTIEEQITGILASSPSTADAIADLMFIPRKEVDAAIERMIDEGTVSIATTLTPTIPVYRNRQS